MTGRRQTHCHDEAMTLDWTDRWAVPGFGKMTSDPWSAAHETSITVRDISQRSDAQVRGPLWLWRVFTPLQMGNSAVYWLVGRKSSGRSTFPLSGLQPSAVYAPQNLGIN